MEQDWGSMTAIAMVRMRGWWRDFHWEAGLDLSSDRVMAVSLEFHLDLSKDP